MKLVAPKTLSTLFFGLLMLASNAQSAKPFEPYAFDSSYKIIGIASRRVNTDGNSHYNFCISHPAAMNLLKKTWKLKSPHKNLHLEDSSVSIYIVKGKQLMEVPLLIFPQQQIANYKNAWYDFDMEKLLSTAQQYPLHCHDKYFYFPNYFEYNFFEDSIQTDPNYLFLFKPSPRRFPGWFDVFMKKDSSSSPEVNALETVNKGIAKRYPADQFLATVQVKDSSSQLRAGEVRVRVECHPALQKKYIEKDARKTQWTEFLVETRVYFKG